MRASIDIGSNSLLLLVVDPDGTTVVDEQRVVGLGKGLGPERGLFRPDRMEAAIDVLRAYADLARTHGVEPARVRAVATSAARRAMNAASFFAEVQKQTGLSVEVISGVDEARYTWLGSLGAIVLPAGPLMVVDPGGGSTEVILGQGREIRDRVSLEIGTVRLTEQFLGYGRVSTTDYVRMREYVDGIVAPLVVPEIPKAVVAVAGTATTLMALELGLSTYDSAAVHGGTLTLASLRKWIDRLLGCTAEARQLLVSVSPGRADTLLVGATILLRVLEQSRRQACRVSDRGLRHGVLQTR